MTRRRVAALAPIFASLALFPALARQEPAADSPPATFKVDPVHSTAIFSDHHLGAGRFYGRFNDVTGTFVYTEGSADALSFDITIPIKSVDTNNERLNRHLKSPDFFNAKEFPTMTFVSDKTRLIGDRTYEVSGTLTIHGVSRPFMTEVVWTGSAQMGPAYRCGFHTTFTIKRSDYGVMYGVENGMVGDETSVILSMEGIRQ